MTRAAVQIRDRSERRALYTPRPGSGYHSLTDPHTAMHGHTEPVEPHHLVAAVSAGLDEGDALLGGPVMHSQRPCLHVLEVLAVRRPGGRDPIENRLASVRADLCRARSETASSLGYLRRRPRV